MPSMDDQHPGVRPPSTPTSQILGSSEEESPEGRGRSTPEAHSGVDLLREKLRRDLSHAVKDGRLSSALERVKQKGSLPAAPPSTPTGQSLAGGSSVPCPREKALVEETVTKSLETAFVALCRSKLRDSCVTGLEDGSLSRALQELSSQKKSESKGNLNLGNLGSHPEEEKIPREKESTCHDSTLSRFEDARKHRDSLWRRLIRSTCGKLSGR